MHNVICQNYMESERGWGVRPDGHSLHLSFEDARKFADEYCKLGALPEVPDEYSRPSGEPFAIVVDGQTFSKVKAAKEVGDKGIWGDRTRHREQ